MIPSAAKAQFERVLKNEQLHDIAALFSHADFFDEVPLYSRYQQVEFLTCYGDVDALLMELSLEYLDRVATEVQLRSKRLVAITVTRDNGDFIVPSIFVCNREVRKRLAELRLSSSLTGFGKAVDRLVKKAKPKKALTTLEDDATTPELVRAFVSYKLPPPGLVSLDIFVQDLKAHRRVG